MNHRAQEKAEKIQARYAGLLMATEVGLGSALHALHLPMSGQVLSLNQIYLLSRAVLKNAGQQDVRKFPFRISLAASLFKSLAPAGKKLTPMLAIAAQGILFGLPGYFLGIHRFSVGLGAALAALWAYVQPVLIYSFIFGQNLVEVGEFYFKELESSSYLGTRILAVVLGGLVLVKIVAAVALALLAGTNRRFIAWQQRAGAIGRARDLRLAESSLPQDLCRPLFWASLALVLVYCYYSGFTINALIMVVLRSIAIVLLIYYGFRLLPLRGMGEVGRVMERVLAKRP